MQSSSGREFERLYRESYELVYNYVRCRMRDDDATEDVVAEAYLKAARSFSKYYCSSYSGFDCGDLS